MTTLLHALASGVIIIAMPVFLTTHCVRWVTLDERFYVDEFARYNVSRVTGLNQDQLRDVARAFISYFTGDDHALQITVAGQPLFNQREIDHMRDVQALMQRVFAAWLISIAAILLSTVALLAPNPSPGARSLARATAIGGVSAAVLVGMVAAGASLDFSQLFLQFHFLSFSNDLWLLDPRRDRLIQLFPEGFFFDAALRIGVQTVLFGLGVAGASVAVLLFARRPAP